MCFCSALFQAVFPLQQLIDSSLFWFLQITKAHHSKALICLPDRNLDSPKWNTWTQTLWSLPHAQACGRGSLSTDLVLYAIKIIPVCVMSYVQIWQYIHIFIIARYLCFLRLNPYMLDFKGVLSGC